MSNVKQDDKSISRALGYADWCYAQFGVTWIFYVQSTENGQFVYNQNPDNYEPFENKYQILGGKFRIDDAVLEIEVFHMVVWHQAILNYPCTN